MRRTTEYATEYKNGNVVINVKDVDMLETIRNDWVYAISEIIYWLDMYFIGGPHYFGNDCGYYTLYNVQTEKIFRLFDRDIEKIKQGKATRLYAYDPDEDDKIEIARFLGEEVAV